MLHAMLLPPGLILVLCAFGWVVGRRNPRAGRAIIGGALLLLLALSAPAVSRALLASLEGPVPDALPAAGDAGALVVLGGDTGGRSPGAHAVEVGALTLQRLAHAARLARDTGLDVLVTGGPTRPGAPPVGRLMADVLERDFGVTANWVDDAALTTWENAENAALLLRPHGVRRVLLVTHAFHMERARAAFEHAGLDVTPAPFAFQSPADGPLIGDLLPRASALRGSSLALHEWWGRAYYALRRALD